MKIPFDLIEAVKGNNIYDSHGNEFRVLHYNEEFGMIMVKQLDTIYEPFLLDVNYVNREFHMSPKMKYMNVYSYSKDEIKRGYPPAYLGLIAYDSAQNALESTNAKNHLKVIEIEVE